MRRGCRPSAEVATGIWRVGRPPCRPCSCVRSSRSPSSARRASTKTSLSLGPVPVGRGRDRCSSVPTQDVWSAGPPKPPPLSPITQAYQFGPDMSKEPNASRHWPGRLRYGRSGCACGVCRPGSAANSSGPRRNRGPGNRPRAPVKCRHRVANTPTALPALLHGAFTVAYSVEAGRTSLTSSM